MDHSGHSGAGMSSAMSAIVQTSRREVFFLPARIQPTNNQHPTNQDKL
jgi:predicted GTPase